ncbi:FAD/NAD(P)-binding protein [Streptomyces sp. C36]|uniref:FAD/NAD(P)-binding protein n=1 Tax=Streptomyces sp. C36 TaxID=3237122 RepID=UPI0034C5BAEF
MATMGRDVVIVGAGFAGTSVFLHLIRAASERGGGRPLPRSVRLVDPRPVGWGVADAVVVCTGVHRPRVPDGFAGFTGHPRYLDSPYRS